MEDFIEQTLETTYNNRTILLDRDLPLKPMSRIRIKVFIEDEKKEYSFFEQAKKMDFDAPPDCSENVDMYMYGNC